MIVLHEVVLQTNAFHPQLLFQDSEKKPRFIAKPGRFQDQNVRDLGFYNFHGYRLPLKNQITHPRHGGHLAGLAASVIPSLPEQGGVVTHLRQFCGCWSGFDRRLEKSA